MSPWTYIGVGVLFLAIGGILGGAGAALSGTTGLVLYLVAAALGVFGSLLTGIGVIAEGVRVGNEP